MAKDKLIGMRVKKTVIAVFITFVIAYFFRETLPFYSAIAAVLCMKSDYIEGYSAGLSRMKGSLIGGFYGYLFTKLYSYLGLKIFSLTYYGLVSISLIPIIYSNLLLNTEKSSYISTVVFLSIVVAHGADKSPLIFAINRVIDTFIGIIVSILVNKYIKNPA